MPSPWTFVPTEIKPQPSQPINILVVGKLVNTDTGDEIQLPNHIFGNDMTAERLSQQAQRIIVAVEERDAAIADLGAKVTLGQAITLPRDKVPTKDEQAAIDAAIAATAFFAVLADLNAMLAQQAKGLKVDETALAAIQEQVKLALSQHPEYAKDVRFR